MLSRTLSRTGAQHGGGPTRWRPVAITATVVLLVALTYWALPKPGPRVREIPLTDTELRALVAPLIAEPPVVDRRTKALADLGRKLFHDPRFSQDGGRACATCHIPDQAFSDGRHLAIGPTSGTNGLMNTPTIANVYLGVWFNWNGRSDSLTSQALEAAEDPLQLGASRTHVVRALLAGYRKEYEDIFGPVSSVLTTDVLAQDGSPAGPMLGLSVDLAARSLATLGSYDQLRDVLLSAQTARRAPAMELSQRAFIEAAPPPISWIASYEALPAATRTAMDDVFVRFGVAIAAYERGLAAVDSPFDQFARRLRDGASPKDALGAGFGAAELTGLRFFVGAGECVLCHSGAAFSDQQFHNIGLPAIPGGAIDVGRASGALQAQVDPFRCGAAALPQDASDITESCRELRYLDTESPTMIGAYKTPSLRNVTATAPYMHDGRFASLNDVLDHYDVNDRRPAVGTTEGTLKALHFTDEERAAITAFLAALAAPIKDYGASDVVGQSETATETTP